MTARYFAALGLAAFLVAMLPARADEMSIPPDRQQLERIIHDYIMAHPEVLIEALKAGDAKAKAKAVEQTRDAIAKRQDDLVHDPDSPVGGNPSGDVTIVEFFDYRCPYCKQVEPALEALLKQDPGLRIVYKEFPILGPESLIASHASLAALKQSPEKYLRLHRALMSAKGALSDDTILKAAEDAGLDVARIKTDMKSPEVEALINRNFALAEALDIRGTPTFIVGDILEPGAVDPKTLSQMVANARKHDKSAF